jgi:hypothetical protein
LDLDLLNQIPEISRSLEIYGGTSDRFELGVLLEEREEGEVSLGKSTHF